MYGAAAHRIFRFPANTVHRFGQFIMALTYIECAINPCRLIAHIAQHGGEFCIGENR